MTFSPALLEKFNTLHFMFLKYLFNFFHIAALYAQGNLCFLEVLDILNKLFPNFVELTLPFPEDPLLLPKMLIVRSCQRIDEDESDHFSHVIEPLRLIRRNRIGMVEINKHELIAKFDKIIKFKVNIVNSKTLYLLTCFHKAIQKAVDQLFFSHFPEQLVANIFTKLLS